MRLPSPSLLVFPPLLLGLGLCGCRKEPAAANPPAAGAAEQTAVEPETGTKEVSSEPGGGADEVIKAVHDGDRAALLAQWSTGDLVEDLVRRGVLTDLDEAGKAAAKAAVDEHFDLLFSHLTQSIGESNRPASMKADPESGLTEVIHSSANQGWSGSTAVRYWFITVEGKQRLVDFEDITVGRRASTVLLPVLVPPTTPWRAPLSRLLGKLAELGKDDAFEQAVAVRTEVAELLAAEPPAEVKGFALKLKAEAQIMGGEYENALATIREWTKTTPGSPRADYLRGIALMRLHRGFEAITAFRRFGDATHCYDQVNEPIGWCHYYEGVEASALASAKLVLKDGRSPYGSLLLAVLSSKPEEIPGLAPHFTNVFDPEAVFEYVLDHLLDADLAEAAREVLRILEKQLPDSELVAVYQKRVGELTE